MGSECEFSLCEERLLLLSEKAIFWERKKILIVSDLHLGKAGHFRKHGIPVSRRVHLTDLKKLDYLLSQHRPKRLILLGDLFHSFENNEWNDFRSFIEMYDKVHFTLVRGNHDILEEYPKQLEVVERLDITPFSFTHEKAHTNLYNLSGHVHPGYRIRGAARQGVTLSCFYFSEDHGILPAFGAFTGIKKIRPIDGDRVFGIVDDQVMALI